MGKSFLIISCKALFCLGQMKVFQPTDVSPFLVFDSALVLSRAIIIWSLLGACDFQQCKCNVKLKFSLMNAAFCVFSLLENEFEPWGTVEGKISSLSFKSHYSDINAFPLLADLFLKCCPVLSVKTKRSRWTTLLRYFCKLRVSQLQLLSQSKYRAPLLQAVLRLTSALDHEVSKPLWWRLVLLMMHKWYPTNNFHTSFVFPAMQKTCLKYQHPSTTVWLWWLNLAVG